MDEFYLNKAKGYLHTIKRKLKKCNPYINNFQKKKIDIELYPAYKPGGPYGIIPKKPNKFIIKIGG